jgi:hypothetical protein
MARTILYILVLKQDPSFTFYFIMANEIPIFHFVILKMTNEKSSCIQFFPVIISGSQNDLRPTFGRKKVR